MTLPTLPLATGAPDVRVLAFYRLPDAAHPARKDAGAELSEWESVRAASPAFAGHQQPQVPGELGYCDVRDPAVREAQAALASAHAVSGFCYVLRSPVAAEPGSTLASIVGSGRPDFPFCVAWETTSLNAGAGFGADAGGHERRYGVEECVALVRTLVGVFADRRYVRIGDRPLFVVSSPDPIVDVRAVAARWREACARADVGDPYIVCFGSALGANPAQLGFDATVECPPLGAAPESRREHVLELRSAFSGDIRNYRSYVGQLLVSPLPEHTMFRTVMPGWDETARARESATIFVNANPETFGYWVERGVELTRLRFTGDERLLFVRSWNEWDAACHLEPDARHGRRYLEALRQAVLRPPAPAPERPSWDAMRRWTADAGGFAATRVVRSDPAESARGPGPSVSVVVPAYNHERYIVTALDSVIAQSHANLEIVVIDDGSRDATGALLDEYAARCRTHPLTVVHQANAGAHEAINRGLALARGDFVAVLNSDDQYAPTRLERMLDEMSRRGSAFGFSNTQFIDDEGNEIDARDPYVRQLRNAIVEVAKAPDVLYVLVYNNIAISTGNFVFRRELLERIGGFCAMSVCHDWDFLLSASHETPLVFVDELLYRFRLHDTNTFAGSRLLAAFELEQVLARFFARIADSPIANDPAGLGRFLEHARRIGLGGYFRRWVAAPA